MLEYKVHLINLTKNILHGSYNLMTISSNESMEVNTNWTRFQSRSRESSKYHTHSDDEFQKRHSQFQQELTNSVTCFVCVWVWAPNEAHKYVLSIVLRKLSNLSISARYLNVHTNASISKSKQLLGLHFSFIIRVII